MLENIPKHPGETSDPSGISLAMIVKDGGKFLAPLLEEASKWVDEIVIGDTGSTDNSKELAIEAGAKVIDVLWQDDFSAARNEVQSLCKGHWILCLDADQRIAPNDWNTLADFARDPQNRQQPVAVSLMTRNYLAAGIHRRGKVTVPDPDPHQISDQPISSGFIPTDRVRFFPNRKGIEFRSIFHETVEASLREACIPVVELPPIIHHLGSLEENSLKNDFYFKLAHTKTRHQPHDAVAWSELATAAINCGDYSEALAAIDRALILNPANPVNRLTLGWLLKKNGQLDTADMQLAAVASLGGVSDLELAEASHLRAQIGMVQRRNEDVVSLLAIAMRLDPENGFIQNTLGVWLMAQGQYEKAMQMLENARDKIPLEIDPWINLGLVYEETGNTEAALEHLQKAFSMDMNNPKVNAAIGRLTMALEKEATKKKPCPSN